MELQYFGGNCVRITTKQANIIIDDNLDSLGLKPVTKPDDILLFTTYQNDKYKNKGRLVIDQPGEYEASTVAIQGIPARSHMDEAGILSATIYKLTANDLRLCVVGHVHPDLNDDQLEAIGTVDVLLVPVGGNGYTLDAIGALKVIKKIEPKIVVPVHYADKNVKYEVPQADLADVLKNMSMEAKETLPKLKLKSSDLQENMELIVLERQ